MGNSGRDLNTVDLAYIFLHDVIHITPNESREFAKKVSAAEMQESQISDKDTLTHKDNRDHEYNSDERRVVLRAQVYSELIHKKRLVDDDKIRMGKGGALPNTELRADKQAFYVIGLPASGKSSVCGTLADQCGAIILDSDYAKRKFPEYDASFGASVVHEESSAVVFGSKNTQDEDCIMNYAISNGYNIVMPKIGDNAEKVRRMSQELVNHEYNVHLVLVRLDREKATTRALHRFVKTKRYVPLSLIYDVYSNNPTITFYDMLVKNTLFKSYTMLDTDVPRGTPYRITYHTEYSPTFEPQIAIITE